MHSNEFRAYTYYLDEDDAEFAYTDDEFGTEYE